MADTDCILTAFFAEHLSLSAKDIQKSVRSREWLLTRLKNVISEDDGPKLFSEEPFLYFGSYFKGTKVADVDEFDVLVVVDSNTGVFSEENFQIGHGLGSAFPNEKYSRSLMRDNGTGLSPTKLLSWLQGVASRAVGSAGVAKPRIDGQAVVLHLSNSDLSVDLVPAGIFESIQTKDARFYNIPSGRNDGWTVTNPKIDKSLFLEAASLRPEMKNITRLIKLLRDNADVSISSYAIECAVIQAVKTNYWVPSVTTNLITVIDSIRSQVAGGLISDMSFPSRNTLRDKKEGERLARLLLSLGGVIIEAIRDPNEENAKQRIFESLLAPANQLELAANH